MASLKQFSTPDWRKLSVDQPYYDSVRKEYCIAVSTDIDYVRVSHTALSNNDTLKTTVKDQGIKNLAKFYNKIDGIEDVASFASKVETELQQRGIANAVANTLRIRDYYMDSRPCSRLRYLVCVAALYWEQLPQKPPRSLESHPSGPVEEVVRYRMTELDDLLNSVADSFIEISQNITTPRPGLNFVEEARRLRAVYPSVLDLLHKNGIEEDKVADLTIQFNFGPATLDEEPTLENCLMTDEIIDIGVLRPNRSNFDELLISKFTFLKNMPIKYARTRKNLRNLRLFKRRMDCPDGFGIWGRDAWWSPPVSLYNAIDKGVSETTEAYGYYEKYSNTRRGRQIVDGLRDRQVWPYNGRKKIKTREEYEAEQGTPTEELKRRIDAQGKREFDFVGSILFSSDSQNALIDEIQSASDAYDKFLNRFDMEYLERILLRLALDSLGIEDINQLIFEKVMEYLDHDNLWGEEGLVANCIPQFEEQLRDEIDDTPGCEDPNAAVKEEILELLGTNQISAEALQTCLQTVCPPASRMFGLKKQVEGLLAYATSDLIPYNRDELCPDPPEDEHPWQGIKFDRFEYDFPNMSNLADTTMALYEEFKKALQNTYDELMVGIVRQILRTLIQNIERILCNWTDMKSFGTALADTTVEGRLGAEIEGLAFKEVWQDNIVENLKSSLRDWGIDVEGSASPADPRSADKRLADFTNEVYACLNPGEFRAAFKGIELGQNLQIIEKVTKDSLPCVGPEEMLAIMGHAGETLDFPDPQDAPRPTRGPGESICDPTYANQVEQNFRDSYTDRAEEDVIQRLWEKEVQRLKDVASDLLGLLDQADPGCQEDLAPSFGDNDFNRSMQQNASNTMLSPVTEAFERNISDWAVDIFRVRPPIDLGDPPPPNAEMIMAAFEQDESVIETIKKILTSISTADSGFITVGQDEPCRVGTHAVSVGNSFYMYPNCDIVDIPDPDPLDFFLRRNQITKNGPMIEIPLPDGRLYDSLEAESRFNKFLFEAPPASQVSSEQYTFSNFLLSTLIGALARAEDHAHAESWLYTEVQKDLYMDILGEISTQLFAIVRNELAKFETEDTIRESNLYDSFNKIREEPAQFNVLLDIEAELELISADFEERVADMSSAERLESPPLQAASVLPLVRILIRASIVEQLFGLLPILPSIGFENVRRSPTFVETMVRLIESVINESYDLPLESIGLDVGDLLGSGEEGVSLKDFVAEELEKVLEKMEQVLDSRSGFFSELPLITVPVKAGPEHVFFGSTDEELVDFEDEDDLPRSVSFDLFIPDPYPYTERVKNNIDFANYGDLAPPRLPGLWGPDLPTDWGRNLQIKEGDHGGNTGRLGRAARRREDPDGSGPHLVSSVVQDLLIDLDVEVLNYVMGPFGGVNYEVLDQEENVDELFGVIQATAGHRAPAGATVGISRKIFEILTGKSIFNLRKRRISEKEFFNFIPREYEPDFRDNDHGVRIVYPHVTEDSKLEFKDGKEGYFIFEKYIEFEPLEEEEFDELVGLFSPQNRAALGYIRTAFEGLLVDSDMSRVQVESVEVFRSLFKRAVLNAFIQFNDFGNLAWKGDLSPILGDDGDDGNNNPFGYNAATPFDWPAWEMTRGRRNIQLLRKLELDFFVVQSFDNQLELQGRGQGSSFRGAFPMSDDLQITNDLFWGNLPLNNIFKSLKTGVRFTFIHTNIDARDSELEFFNALDEGVYNSVFDIFENGAFNNGFPERFHPDWAKYCNIRKAYDVFLQEEGGEVLEHRARRLITIPMVEQEDSITNLTVANFYGKKGLLDPVERRRFIFDGSSPEQFVRPRGFANEEGLLDDLPTIAINVGNLAGLSDSEIHDFERLRQDMINSNPVFEVFSNFAVPFDDILSAIVANAGQEVFSSGFEILKETKRNIMLMLYAMSPSVSANAVGDLDASREWLLRYFP